MGAPQPFDEVSSVVAAARLFDPSVDEAAGQRIALGCLERLREEPDLDAAELARRYVATDPAADPSWVNHIARALCVG